MKMSVSLIIVGSLILLAPIVYIAAILPWASMADYPPSEIFRPRTALEELGRKLGL